MHELADYQIEMILATANWLSEEVQIANDKLNVFGLNAAIQIDYDCELATHEPFITLWLYNMNNGSCTCLHYDDLSSDVDVFTKLDLLESLWPVL